MTDPRIDPETGRYLPIRYPEEMPYWEAAQRHELVLQRCSACGKLRYPIGPTCPACLSDESTWDKMSGRGQVSTYVVYHKAFAPWLEQYVPYVVVQVELAEGPRLTTNLRGIDPNEVRIGMEVEAIYEKLTDDITLLQFQPA